MKNPLTLEAFAEWCEKQPADEEYEIAFPNNCAVTRYLREGVGLPVLWTNLAFAQWTDTNHVHHPFPRAFGDAAHGTEEEAGRLTFGALATRLRYQSENPL